MRVPRGAAVPSGLRPGVGDCSDLVTKKPAGYVFREDLQLDRVVSEVRGQRATLRKRCEEVAAGHFDGDSHLPVRRELVTGRVP